jgi:hypothetical protein
MRISKLKTNKRKETEGVWCKIAIAEGGMEVKVTRNGNAQYRAYVRRMKFNRGQVTAVSDDLMEELHQPESELQVKAVANTVLKDWRGVEDDNDKPVPFSIARAEEWLRDIQDFRDEVWRVAGERSRFQSDVEKNSSGGSAGPSSGATSTAG